MKSLIGKIIIGAAGLALATAPLAASAQDGYGHANASRGGYTQRSGGYARGGGYQRGGYGRSGGVRFNVGYSQPVYQEGYYGWAPGGYQGYYSNGNWYHHRRWHGGIWIYF
jgi:hypothetical protein